MKQYMASIFVQNVPKNRCIFVRHGRELHYGNLGYQASKGGTQYKLYFWPKSTYSKMTNRAVKKWLKTVAFIAGKKNPATQKQFICFSIEIKL